VIAIVDYGVGNLAAVANMLQRVGAKSKVTAEPAVIAAATGIVLPGNGAFDACMQGLRATGLVPLLETRVLNEKIPLFGICVGAQILGRGSEEGQQRGLGWLDFSVRRLPASSAHRVPHMGWGNVEVVDSNQPLLAGLESDARFYFSHSYYMDSAHSNLTLLRGNHGLEFAAAVGRGNLFATQFHPEKSHRFGKILLANFAKLCHHA
jgi:imidazole glycerol-phosphate synthase subunit HisH